MLRVVRSVEHRIWHEVHNLIPRPDPRLFIPRGRRGSLTWEITKATRVLLVPPKRTAPTTSNNSPEITIIKGKTDTPEKRRPDLVLNHSTQEPRQDW
jgi:hypothetical protein